MSILNQSTKALMQPVAVFNQYRAIPCHIFCKKKIPSLKLSAKFGQLNCLRINLYFLKHCCNNILKKYPQKFGKTLFVILHLYHKAKY